MGRSTKVGLDYFELDCYMDQNVRLIQAEYGLKGFAIVVKLYQKIYGELGYYCEWNEDSSLLFMSENGVSSRDEKNLINEIVAACIRRGIFSEQLFKRYGILTSAGVQRRYLNAVSKREKVELKKEYLLVPVPKNSKNVDIYSISDGRNAISDGRNPQSRVEESRVEESRVEYSSKRAERARLTPGLMIDNRHFSAALSAVVHEWVNYKAEKRQQYKQTGLSNFLTQVENNVQRYGEAAVIDLIHYCMAQNWQGVIFDRLADGRRAKAFGRDASAGGQTATDSNGVVWPVIDGVDWSKV